MELILEFYDVAKKALDAGVSIERLVSLPVRERIGRFKYIEFDKHEAEYKDIVFNINREIDELLQKEDF